MEGNTFTFLFLNFTFLDFSKKANIRPVEGSHFHFYYYFYRTQVSLGSGLWVPVSLSSHQGGRQGGARVAGNIGAVIMLTTIKVWVHNRSNMFHSQNVVWHG